MNIGGVVKAHPVATAVVVAVVAGGTILVTSRGGSSTAAMASPGASDSSVQAGLQLQALQTSAGLKAAEISAQENVANKQADTAFAIAGLQKELDLQKLAASKEVALAGISAQQQEAQITAGTTQAQIAADSAKYAGMLDTLLKQSENQTSVSLASIQAQESISKDANKPKGLFSFLFG